MNSLNQCGKFLLFIYFLFTFVSSSTMYLCVCSVREFHFIFLQLFSKHVHLSPMTFKAISVIYHVFIYNWALFQGLLFWSVALSLSVEISQLKLLQLCNWVLKPGRVTLISFSTLLSFFWLVIPPFILRVAKSPSSAFFSFYLLDNCW